MILGQHGLLDCYGVNPALLADPIQLKDSLIKAANHAGATILNAHFHHFGEHQGVTGVLLLKESHLSIHTWPEYDYAAIDVFMCGQARPDLALQTLLSVLQPQHHSYQLIHRGFALSQSSD